jgi:hypothetical protein
VDPRQHTVVPHTPEEPLPVRGSAGPPAVPRISGLVGSLPRARPRSKPRQITRHSSSAFLRRRESEVSVRLRTVGRRLAREYRLAPSRSTAINPVTATNIVWNTTT